ncbi:MAG: DUF4258 domain-containing protein [Pelotomaculum sp.]|nr:DUF4258 domain-containing protein [Pelotomaculum sp.]
MDPKDLIRKAAEEDSYDIVEHALKEADKDGLTIHEIENVMIYGKINQKDPKKSRYRLRYRNIQIIVEVISNEVTIVTVMRDR